MEALFDITQEEIPIFLAEAYEQLQVLDEGLVRLERQEEDSELLQALFRAAHTLKGSSGMIHHKRMVEVTHTLEAAFDRLRKGELAIGTELIDACLEAVDVLRLLCEEVPQGMSSEAEIEGVMAMLKEAAGKPSSADGGDNADQKVKANRSGKTKPAGSADQHEGERKGGGKMGNGAATIRAVISPESIAPAARAFQLMLAVQAMTEVTAMSPEQAAIEAGLPVSEFWAEVRLTAPMEELLRELEMISEIQELEINGKPMDAARVGETGESSEQDGNGKKSLPLGQYLVENGLVSEAQLQAAILEQKKGSGPTELLGQTLVRLGLVSQEVLDEILADQSREKKKAPKGKTPQNVESAGVDKSRMKNGDKTIRTSVDRLDSLMNLVGELITDRNRLNLIRSNLENTYRGAEEIETLSETITHVGRITDQLQAEVMGIRMLPISNLFNKFPRLVRDLARTAGKQVELVMRGEDTELDRSVIEEVSDPLIHLLRNAVDHGLETPEERREAGKPERGIVLLTARHEQGRIVITVEDNGRGIDVQRVKQKAVDKGLMAKAEAETMGDEEAIDLIFVSGLSTAKSVSSISGRGVGMDIVRNNIERLNGSIVVETWPGKGTQFQIVLPLTLAIVPTLLVRVGISTYAIPLVTITETLRVAVAEIQTVNSRPVIILRDHVLPVARLQSVYNLRVGANGSEKNEHEYIVVVRSGKAQLGLIVDSLVGEEEVVVKSLSEVIGEINGVSSAAILGDGQVALIVDVPGLLKLALVNLHGVRG